MQKTFDKLTPSDLGILQVVLDDLKDFNDETAITVLKAVIEFNYMADPSDCEDFANHIVNGINRRLEDGS